MSKRFWLIIVILVGIFGGVFWFGHRGKDSNSATAVVKPTEHITGKTDSKVKLVEYGDFQCPYCATYYPVMQQVEQKYGDRIAVQFREYPLASVHQNAFAAARAAEAASNQGKFWDMYNVLYSNQSTWSEATNVATVFQNYASQIGLNIDQFKTDFSSQAVNNSINADIDAFNKLNLTKATPTYILDGNQIKPSATIEDFSKFIDAELKAQGIEAPSENSSTNDLCSELP